MIHVSLHHQRGTFALDVSFQTDARVIGLFGPSGSGKTTLIHLLAGLERPERGTISVAGEPLLDCARGVDVPVHRRRIGVVFQEHRLFPHLSVRGNLRYGRGRNDPRGEGGFDSIVELLELRGLLDRRVTQISGGERQRVALGRMLLSQPRWMLLDEPLSSLDMQLRAQILPFLQRVRDAGLAPMLYVTHDLAEMLQLTDHLLILEHGSVVGQGRYMDLVHDAAVMTVVHDRGLSNILPAWVVRHEPAEGVSVVRLSEHDDPARRWMIPLCREPVGTRLTLSIRPWDVALAAHEVHPVSIQNQVPGVVTRCTPHERRAIVEVDVGVPLIVEVSRKSSTAMNLKSGSSIVCLVKSHAIRPCGGG